MKDIGEEEEEEKCLCWLLNGILSLGLFISFNRYNAFVWLLFWFDHIQSVFHDFSTFVLAFVLEQMMVSYCFYR